MKNLEALVQSLSEVSDWDLIFFQEAGSPSEDEISNLGPHLIFRGKPGLHARSVAIVLHQRHLQRVESVHFLPRRLVLHLNLNGEVYTFVNIHFRA